MGLQRLLLALTVLLVMRLFTFASPLPDELRLSDLTKFAKDEAAKLGGSDADPFELDAPPQSFYSQSPVQPDTLHPVPEQDGSSDTDLPYQNERNPVEEWDTSQRDTNAFAQGDSNFNGDNACQAAKSAVVTVRAGREIGSGSIVSNEGLVITNFHVIRRLREQPLFVQTQGGNRLSGQVIASDRRNDLALIQLQVNETLPTIRLASTDSSERVGQFVCAIGSPFGQAGKITQGRLVRILGNGDLQSDVELQPGNSGGPLINLQGEMIGINKGVAHHRGENEQISYATSAIVAQQFIEQNRFAAPISGRTFRE